MRIVGALVAMLGLAAASANAAPTKPKADSDSFLPGGDSKAPISVEADKLDYFEKESKAVYSGNVVAIQGESKLTCSVMTIYMEKSGSATGAPTPTPTPASNGSASQGVGSSSVRHMDCGGPVTMVSKTQTATGDTGSFDKPQNRVLLTGHVTLSDGRNVTKGDRLIYDMTTGQATVEAGANRVGPPARVTGQFLPNGGDGGSSAKPKTP
jgi:lipopolysaccharide export system protein LptA